MERVDEQSSPDVFVEHDGDPGVPLCPHCLEVTEEGWHFCPVCMAPLSWFASTAPYESIWAAAWILARPFQTLWPRRVHMLGQVFVFGPDLVTLVLLVLFVLGSRVIQGVDAGPVVFPGVSELPHGAGSTLVLGVLTFLVSRLVHLGFLWRSWANFLRRKDVDPWAEDEAGDAVPV